MNPCRKCEKAYIFNNRAYNCLTKCKKRIEYEKYLASKRKYKEGKPIESLNELLEQEFVMFHGKTLHISVVRHWQFEAIIRNLNNGTLKKAEKRNDV